MNVIKHVALATSLITPALCWAADLPTLSVDEQTKMNRTLLGYYMQVERNGCGQGVSDCYVVTQKRVPSQSFLDSSGSLPGRLKPWRGAAYIHSSGRRYREINIGEFRLIGQKNAQAYITENCGAGCGTVSRATLKRAHSGWAVQSLEMIFVK